MHKENFSLYKGSVTLEYNDNTHRYFVVEDGKRKSVPSVTTVCNVLNKPALQQWAVNQAVDLVQQGIGPGVEYNELYLTGVFAAARKAHDAIRDDAAALGTRVHRILDLENAPTLDAEEDRVRSGVGAARAWLALHKVETIYAELPIYSRDH